MKSIATPGFGDPHVALVGNLSEGFEAHGPYADPSAAAAAHQGEEAWIARLLAPTPSPQTLVPCPDPRSAEARALRILTDAGIDARLEHTGGGIWVAEARSQTIEGRVVWVTDGEGEGPFLVGVYPSTEIEVEAIDSLSGICSEAELVAKVQVGLQDRVGEER